jgi:hypothetical protein
MSISDATLSSDVWTAVKTLLVSATPTVTLGGTSPTTYTATIAASYNDKAIATPTIVVNPIDIDEQVIKFGNTRGTQVITVTMDCYYKNTLGVDQLADQVINALATTAIEGLPLSGWTTTTAWVNPNEAKYQLKTVVAAFRRE